ncbi:uncharacterized protein LOC105202869 [Solenopsis invicta]|uniref:uncharacterized protein LOC105202869 n=1 Tax=Solenopsis invicta TaxID=13686 RepID=UPI00193D06D4|nr:uncharacterized protein LOC105202869 [Solenopsis invicta]
MPDSSETGAGSGAAPSKAAQLRSLKQKRSQVKSQCTRCATYLGGLDAQNTSVVELRQRLKKFSETWNDFNTVQTAIEEIQDSPEDARGHDEERATFEERYFQIATELEILIENKTRNQMLTADHTPQLLRGGTPATQGSVGINDHLKLPRVNLPTFAGAFEEWMPFRNMFQSMIDNNTSLPKVQKMQYLISALRGEARDVVGSLEVAEENYIEAWEMLKERYDDPGLIIQKHIRALFDVPTIVKENHLLIRRLMDNVLKHLRALKALKRPTDYWDDLVIHLVTSRLDPKTSRAWEVTLKRGEIPTLKQLTDFLAQHSKALEASIRTARTGSSSTGQDRIGQARATTANIATTNNKCAYCEKENHAIYKCEDYLRLDVSQRIKEARSRRLCLNCLKAASHQTKHCNVKPCRQCNKRHNTLLHLEQALIKKAETLTESSSAAEGKIVATSINHAASVQNKQVLLATAVVKVTDSRGNEVLCRALLDSGAQSCFITSSCAKKLALEQFGAYTPVRCLGELSTRTNKRVRIKLQSRINKFKADLDCLIIDQIIQFMPDDTINTNDIQIPEGIILADPEFYEPARVDLLLGAEIFYDIMCIGRIKLSTAQPTWQKTLLGWIISGSLVTTARKQNGTMCNLAIYDQLNANLTRFWQIEHNERQSTRSPEERACKKHLANTYKRNKEGRFIVSMPIKEDRLQELGESRERAVQRFRNLERKFTRQPQLKQEYARFIHEYLKLKHMKEIRKDDARWNAQPQCYLPHHCVIKEASSTTKLRVVFDASSKDTKGVSLNDILMVGPVLQQDLVSILLRFRSFKYVITGDIAKMYRQILITDDQTALQRIVWRDDPNQELKTYELLTLTYGTAPASFLATKVIYQLAELEENRFPKGAAIARRDFYMDDLITGANSIEEAVVGRDQAAALLQKRGFTLRKWASNHPELLKNIQGCTTDGTIMELDKDGAAKTLGVKWNHEKDVFQYSIKIACPTSCTKRQMLSGIAQIFDPVGLLAPVILTAKLLIQELWRLQLGWDESLPTDVFTKWSNYVTDIQCLNEFCVQRRVMEDAKTSPQLHGFCDASEKAYGACIYVRSLDRNNMVRTQLLCAKSRVAPLKAVSIPRLELCGAQLLVQLTNKVKTSCDIKIEKVYYWTDSSIVLHWIKATNKKLPVFVAHRVGEIQEFTSIEDWNHVGTKENPADLVSRGVAPKELCESQLWWHGPIWLKDQVQIDRRADVEDIDDEPEQQSDRVIVAMVKQAKDNIVSRFSSLQKLVRVTATCIKFAWLCKKESEVKASQPLTVEELEQAKKRIVKMEQLSAFGPEMRALCERQAIGSSSKLKHLNPFLDNDGLLRVGGADATLAAVRQLYWPLKARGAVRKITLTCIKCFRLRPRNSEQIMGSLPISRVTPSRPFANTGVDFCGPIYVRERRGRGAKRVKAYVAVFICMAVKAVHLEVVSDLTTDAFLNAFKRFISRRGKPTNVYSDNGTNFIGANRELEKCLELFRSEQSKRKILDHGALEKIKWHFIPARAPHFGGLWEAAVKACKTHFYKTAAEAAMTFEEASTLVAQIVAILNSRPITALSDDPNDLSFLSPGHFLIGDALTSYPEGDVLEIKVNRLSRWQMVERIRQHFWKRWSSEYLLNLQRRNKWLSNTGPQIKVGQLVVCREDGLPPLKWALGRVQSVYPGMDGVVRTATIRTATGEYKRPAAKLCILPVEDSTNSSKE